MALCSVALLLLIALKRQAVKCQLSLKEVEHAVGGRAFLTSPVACPYGSTARWPDSEDACFKSQVRPNDSSLPTRFFIESVAEPGSVSWNRLAYLCNFLLYLLFDPQTQKQHQPLLCWQRLAHIPAQSLLLLSPPSWLFIFLCGGNAISSWE